MKEEKDLSYKRIFCIRENNKWVAGICHAGRSIKLCSDKKQEIALLKLCNELYKECQK